MSEIQIAAREGRVARRRALVRQRILEAAEQLMTERGVDDVTIDDITDAADIARRSFYHHFESKHDVLVPIARSRTKALNERIDRLASRMDDPAEVMATAATRSLGHSSPAPASEVVAKRRVSPGRTMSPRRPRRGCCIGSRWLR